MAIPWEIGIVRGEHGMPTLLNSTKHQERGMEHINQIIERSSKSEIKQPEIMTRQPNFSTHERDVTGYFFLRLSNIYPQQYQTAYPDKEAVNYAKKEYAKTIGQFSREQINEAFEQCKLLKRNNHKDFKWPDVDAVLGLITKRWEEKCHKSFEPLALPDKSAMERSEAIGKEILKDLKALLA